MKYVTELDLTILEEDVKSVLDLKSLPIEARRITTGVLKKIQDLKTAPYEFEQP